MSLKAKIEAVIYAAEEPVTLAQLAALFQAEVLEVREARLSAEAAAREQAAEAQAGSPESSVSDVSDGDVSDGEVADGELSVSEAVDGDGPNATDDQAEVAAEDGGAVVEEAEAAAGSGEDVPAVAEVAVVEETGVVAAEGAAEGVPEAAAEVVPTPEDEKRAARQRDREIREELRGILNALIAEYAESDRGMEIREIAGGYRVATKPEYHDAVRGFVKSLKPPMKLSLQALETLAVIAYKQPVTAPEVGDIRGVDSGGVLGSLISRKLIATAGRKQVIGRPILYKTTKEFLLRFGLKDLNELPSIEEFEKMAGELAESDEVPGISRPELPFQPDEIEEPGEGAGISDDESDEAREIRSQDDAETQAAAVAAVGVSDENDDQEGDLPGIVVEAEVKPAHMVDAGEAASEVGQPGEGD
jgi:segregation and condensation protein B